MPKIFVVLLSILFLKSYAGQTAHRPWIEKPFIPKVSTLFYKLGERVIQIKTFQYGDVKDMVYINLHDDEVTAINGARKILEKKGGLLIKIENYRTRNIRFKLESKYYTIDPNRIFSRHGIAQSLLLLGNTSPKAIVEIEKFASRILQLIPQNPSCIVALHNNSNGRFSINTYLPGGAREKDARSLHVNPDMDADDFYLTTDSLLFKHFVAENYNSILQDNDNAKKDGSLSIYCGEKNIQYVNCETEHGRQIQYDEMIVLAVNKVDKSEKTAIVEKILIAEKPEKHNPDMITFNYRILPGGGHVSLKNNSEISFGEKKVGLIKSAMVDSAWNVSGKLEINKNFPLSSNMDFFVFVSPNNPPRLEVRVDPTRQGTPVNNTSLAAINIGVRAGK